MDSIFRAVAVGGLVVSLVGCVSPEPVYYPAVGTQDQIVVYQQPPPPQMEVIAPAPVVGYTWSAGHWRWGNGAWFWTPGQWIAPRPGYSYLPGYWGRRGGAWVYQPPHWHHY
jgi:hypothetical protein